MIALGMCIVLISGDVLFDLTEKLTLEAVSSTPFQTQACLSPSVHHGTLFRDGMALPSSVTGKEERHE